MTTDELDLHGYTIDEAFDMFHLFYTEQLRAGKKPFTVIHGYGSQGTGGNMRRKLRAFLSAHPDRVTISAGEHTCGNQGITLVKPIKPLPSKIDLLSEQILEYCNVARTKEKISGKFRNSGSDQVMGTIRKLEKSGVLKTITKGKFKCYISD